MSIFGENNLDKDEIAKAIMQYVENRKSADCISIIVQDVMEAVGYGLEIGIKDIEREKD